VTVRRTAVALPRRSGRDRKLFTTVVPRSYL
jgi:hypothetical protein